MNPGSPLRPINNLDPAEIHLWIGNFLDRFELLAHRKTAAIAGMDPGAEFPAAYCASPVIADLTIASCIAKRVAEGMEGRGVRLRTDGV